MAEIIAVCGAGGKTTLIFRLKDHFISQGKKVLICTSTHMLRESFTDVSGDSTKILHIMMEEGWVMAGIPAKNPEKITALPENVMEKLEEKADVILLEADGSRHHSVKYPASDEPVLPQNLTRAIVILGSWDLGKEMGEVVHRADPSRKEILTEKHLEEIFKIYGKKISASQPSAAIEYLISQRTAEGRIKYQTWKMET